MGHCDAARERLALDPAEDDSAVREHLAGCAGCAAYGRRHAALDTVLRAELSWQVPASLTASLLALAVSPLALRPRPKTWYVNLVAWLTFAAVSTGVLVIWQFVAQLGGAALLAQAGALPAQLLAQLKQALPQSGQVLDTLALLRDQAVWLLLAAVLWAMLDKWRAERPPQRQRA